MPRFSIVLVHYQGCTPHRSLCRCVNSLVNQTHQDFELLAYHDGPLQDMSVVLPVPFKCTDTDNDWGHLAHLGIREATGDCILTMNSDNILYPNAERRSPGPSTGRRE